MVIHPIPTLVRPHPASGVASPGWVMTVENVCFLADCPLPKRHSHPPLSTQVTSRDAQKTRRVVPACSQQPNNFSCPASHRPACVPIRYLYIPWQIFSSKPVAHLRSTPSPLSGFHPGSLPARRRRAGVTSADFPQRSVAASMSSTTKKATTTQLHPDATSPRHRQPNPAPRRASLENRPLQR